MSAPRWGPVIDSIWSPTTFNAEVLRNIAGKAFPDEPFLGEAEHLAQAMNSAACELLLSLRGHKKAADAETWALGIAEACAALVSSCGHPSTRAALRLGLPHRDFPRFAEMLETAQHVQVSASLLAARAAAEKKNETVARPAGEDVWICRMAAIFEACFGRDAGITKNLQGERGGPCARFIAEAARTLAADPAIQTALDVRRLAQSGLPRSSKTSTKKTKATPPTEGQSGPDKPDKRDEGNAWAIALKRLSRPKTVAARLERFRRLSTQ